MWFCKGGLVHDGEFSPTFHTLLTERNHLEEKKCMNYVADLAFLLDLVKSLDFLTSICYFAIVAPQTKAGQTELRKLQEVVEVLWVGVWILGVLIFLIPTGSARFRSIKKQGGRFWESNTPPKLTWTALWPHRGLKKTSPIPFRMGDLVVGSFRRSSSRVSRDGIPRSSWKGR